MLKLAIRSAAVFVVAIGAVFAQTMPISTDGTDPKTWDPKLDAVKAGAKNHKVIFEDKEIRVLSVTVEPGEVEVAHHHQWPSVIVFDRPTKRENRDINGKLLVPKGNPEGKSRRELFGEPIKSPPAFREPASRLALMNEQGIDRTLMFPTLASVVEERMKHDPYFLHAAIHALNEAIAAPESPPKSPEKLVPARGTWFDTYPGRGAN